MAVFFTPDDAKRVNDVGRELMAVLTRGTNGEIDAALNADACIECARVLLHGYSPAGRAALLQILVPYLERGEAPRNMERVGLIQ